MNPTNDESAGTIASQEDATFAEAVLGRKVLEAPPLKRFLQKPWSVVVLTGLFASLVFIPYLGAVGLWDCWETHYGEVAREMIQRNDYVHPYWENAWFFSKPVLTMWMTSLGMQVAGTNRTSVDEPVALFTEWCMRMPFALASIGALCLLAYALSRTANRRVALATVFVLITMPLYFLETRQAVTDMPFVATMIAAISCAMIGQFDRATRRRAAWWYAFYVLLALSMLAKELIGVGITAATLMLYGALCVVPLTGASLQAHYQWLSDPKVRAEVRGGRRPMPALWAQMFNMHLGTVIVFCLIALPWLLVMVAFDGVDDEGKTFLFRYFLQDNFNRLVVGVHTTTPGGAFTYFIEQGGYAIFPWVALVPGALTLMGRLKLRSSDARDHVAVLATLWCVLSFGLIGSSATKFHHYTFPMLPGLAIVIGLFIDRLWTEGVRRNVGALILGLPLFALVGKDLAENPKNFTDLFVYNYDRPYPFELDTRPIAFWEARPLWSGDLIALVTVVLGGYLAYAAFTDKTRSVLSRSISLLILGIGGALVATVWSHGHVSPTMLIGAALIAVAFYVAFEASRLEPVRRGNVWTGAALVGLIGCVLAYVGNKPLAQDQLLPQLVQSINVKTAMGFAFGLAGALAVIGMVMKHRTFVFGTFWALAASFAIWYSWGHWVDLAHNWTQRDLFWQYYKLRQPEEPIAAFLMNWRGETFYSKNTVHQIPAQNANERMHAFAELSGRKWALVEHARFGVLKAAVGGSHSVTPIGPELNNKFLLVRIE